MKQLDKLIYEIGIKQYEINNSKSKEYIKVYREERQALEKELFTAISKTTENMTKNEVDRFMAKVTPDIIESMQTIGKWEQYTLSDRLEAVYKGVYYETGQVVGSGLKQAVEFDIVRLEFIEKSLNNKIAGEKFSKRIWKNKAKLADRVYNSVYETVREGTGVRELSRELAKDYDIGIMESMRLLQNETSRVVNEAQDEIYRQSEVVDEVTFTATLDNLTSDTCQTLDGTTYDKNDDRKPTIPEDTHINCRSCYIPIVKGWSPTTRRDNLTKETIEYVTFKDYNY